VPEGDTVWLTAHTLDRSLRGRTVALSDFRVPQLATASLVGSVIDEVVPKGKHLLMRTDDGRTLHSHLRMDGSWHVYAAGRTWRGPAHQIRALLTLDDGTSAVGYRVHDLAIVTTDDEGSVVGHLGPDLLDPEADLAEAVARLVSDPDRELGPALLDQRNLAGIGNLYKAETLFWQRLTPWTRVGDVDDLPAVVARARRLLDANKERFEQSTTGDLRRGHDHWVFERAGQACRRCGTTIRSAEQGTPPYQRWSYWCPSCQEGPGPTG
jgi:endonuclease-8